MEELSNSSAKQVFDNFIKISQIPRCSNDEEKISKYVYNFGLNLGYESTRDEYGNVIIIKPASEGYEDHDTVILQSHLDMVCEKTEDSNHDFTCDPIDLYVEGDILKARDTTLGADDGAGVALMLAILEDKSLQHPKLECLFTTTEETGMDGALGLSENVLTGKNLINLDNEEDWIIIVGCAGGVRAEAFKEFERVEKDNLINFKIKVSGLQGGHSGSMIHEARANAIKLVDSLLLKIKNKVNFSLHTFDGGSKHNAIPSSSFAIIGIDNNDVEEFKNAYEEYSKEIKDSNLKRELDLVFDLEEIDADNLYIAEDASQKILKLVQIFPHGVNTMDKELGIVKSSNNLAIIRTSDNSFNLETSIRSSDSEDLDYLCDEVKKLGENDGFKVSFSEGYPMWKPNFDNELLNIAKDTYKDLRNEDVEVLVIHAGLETGIFSEKYPDINMISMGPTITGAHTPAESISIKSTEFSFEYLKTLLKNL
ncbi:aminoacyl-histidine dipeptidase [Helcococcus sueciensis]|uniref:aminoacyl-histidine dipeptidase n=1 Tax=Helcococcus sueciensis TaxID=241555 RepID=UPI0004057F33|nr:aminoacyl-histidine dipeptidase [Helcococcus sueciensis]